MSTKFIEVATTDIRKFVSTILELGSKGGVLTDECRVIKGLIMRALVQVPEDSVIDVTPIMRVIVKEDKKPAKVSLTLVEDGQSEKEPVKQTRKRTKSEPNIDSGE